MHYPLIALFLSAFRSVLSWFFFFFYTVLGFFFFFSIDVFLVDVAVVRICF